MRRRISKPLSFSPALQRLGRALPPPFVGRAGELAGLADAASETAVLVVTGAVGAGKTRLARELCARRDLTGPLRASYLRCWPGDRPDAVRARAERVLGVPPGMLDVAMREEPHLLVVDDAHNIAGAGVGGAFAAVVHEPGAGRLVLMSRETPALPRTAPARFELGLGGLDDAAARELWAHLEETYGPTPAGACDAALCRTRGLPLALRREYASAATGKEAWSVDRLAEAVRAALETVAVASVPVAPSAVAALAPAIDVEASLIELVSRQLIDPIEDGRFAIHDVVRDEVLAGMTPARRAELERGAAALVLRGAEDGGAFGVLDPVDALRFAVHHLIAAGDGAGAEAALVERAPGAIHRAAGGEILGLIQALGGQGAALGAVRAAIAARRGEVAAARDAGPADPVLRAVLACRAGEIAVGRAELVALARGGGADGRAAHAAAALAELEVERGDEAAARALVDEALGAGQDDASRAALLLALGAIEASGGRYASARAGLSRALAAAAGRPELTARIEARRARCLLAEGRGREADAVLDAAERAATDADCGDAADEVRGVRALARAARGDLLAACDAWGEIVFGRRARGDELGALRGELEWAEVLERRGELIAAAQLAVSVDACAARLELGALRARAAAVAIAIDAAAWRRPAPALDDTAAPRHRLAALAARGETRSALDCAREAVAAADRVANQADLADALAWCARLELAGGDRRAAELVASRAAREAATAGATWARCTSLLVLAAVTREQGDLMAASSYARDAAEVAATAGLPVERAVAERALAAIAGGGGRAEPCSAEATLGELARCAAARAVADLGLSAMRPFRVVGCDGQVSRVADASPERLGLAARDLVVDGVREAIVRGGKLVADLRRRSLLKRLLFLFAAAPGRVFSKEEIVQTVWAVEYHPLRHDAALFTNIMRIRRLLGRDGADLIRVSEDGYRFTPAADFLFVEPVSA